MFGGVSVTASFPAMIASYLFITRRFLPISSPAPSESSTSVAMPAYIAVEDSVGEAPLKEKVKACGPMKARSIAILAMSPAM